MQLFYLKSSDSVTSGVSTQVSKQTNILTHFIIKIDWDKIFSTMITITLSLILLSIFFSYFTLAWEKKLLAIVLKELK